MYFGVFEYRSNIRLVVFSFIECASVFQIIFQPLIEIFTSLCRFRREHVVLRELFVDLHTNGCDSRGSNLFRYIGAATNINVSGELTNSQRSFAELVRRLRQAWKTR